MSCSKMTAPPEGEKYVRVNPKFVSVEFDPNNRLTERDFAAMSLDDSGRDLAARYLLHYGAADKAFNALHDALDDIDILTPEMAAAVMKHMRDFYRKNAKPGTVTIEDAEIERLARDAEREEKLEEPFWSAIYETVNQEFCRCVSERLNYYPMDRVESLLNLIVSLNPKHSASASIQNDESSSDMPSSTAAAS